MSQATSITVHVPLNIQRRGGRKVVIAPDGSVLPQARPSLVPPTADPVLVKALARAFRWKRMLDEGRYASVQELAADQKVDRGYTGRLLRLTLLAPESVEAILNGGQSETTTLQDIENRLLPEWHAQIDALIIA